MRTVQLTRLVQILLSTRYRSSFSGFRLFLRKIMFCKKKKESAPCLQSKVGLWSEHRNKRMLLPCVHALPL
ncbi:hypothetical protein M404DRAFT_491225 [Pisolithus tinctorius Marx 270]|uniref:Uncharacterized protein n=1 Tax=Pisolithus tinctorius Marx 270 TaxID=870435 RepID=A0A0C3NYX1_PISTI|nr:hypothetical protein M404DRAFT_491225 [Pisolithus tinctorius Marx 270]